nr:thiamine-triphosphatase-like [Lytechinus pictus]
MSKEEMGDKIEPKMIEIERKFLVSGDTGEKIVNAGGTFSGVVTLTDSYFDNENYSLTKEDFWLRRRNDQWELKMPPKNRQDESASCTQYKEVTNEHDIVTEMAAILCNSSPNDDAVNGNDQIYEAKDVETMITKFGLEPFAELKTNRKNYRMNDEISITIDETDFGFQVGEIEMMVQSSDADVISDAVAKIEGVAQSLGMEDFGTLSVADYLDESILAHISNCI